MAKEIVLYNADKTEQLFPKTEASSVYDSATGFTVRDEISDLDQRITKIEDNPVDLSGYYTKVEVDNKESAQNIYIQGLDERVSELEDGNVEIDLSDYYTKDEVDSKVPTVQSGGFGNSNNYIYSDYSLSDTGHKTSVLTHVYVEPKPEADSVRLYTYKNYWGIGSGTTNGSYKSLPSATTELAGVMSASDKAKLDSLEPVDLSEKQDTLVSGTNIKTINGESVLGSGDIELATDGLKIVDLTQEEYNSLTSYSDNTVYVVKDKPSLSGRVAELEKATKYSINWYNPDENISGYKIDTATGLLISDSNYSVSGLIDLDFSRRKEANLTLPQIYLVNPNSDGSSLGYRFLDENKNIVGIPDEFTDTESTVMSGSYTNSTGYLISYPDYAKYIQLELPNSTEGFFLGNYSDVVIYNSGITEHDFPEYSLETFNSMCSLIKNLEKRIAILEGK